MGKVKRITSDEADKMFSFWCQCGNVTATAREFKRSVSAVHRLIKGGKWAKRRENINDARDRDVGKAKAKSDVDDLTMVTAMQARVKEIIMDEKKWDVDKVRISDFVALTRLAAELRGDLPPDQTDGDMLADAVAVVKKLSTEETETLEESIATVIRFRKKRPVPIIVDDDEE